MKMSFTICPSVRLILASLCLGLIPFRHLPAASIELDENFHPPFFAEPAYADRAKLLSDGSYLLYFNISSLTDQRTGGLMKLASDGTFDSSFDLARKYNAVFAVAELPNGQLIVAASQSVYGRSEEAAHILRINTDGSIDPSFNPIDATITGELKPGGSSGDVRAIVVQSDGKIVIAGAFGAFGGVNHPGVVRLLADGALDATFAAVEFEFSQTLSGLGMRAAATQADGKVIIAGSFDSVNGVPDPGVARLNTDGSLDATFNPSGFVRFSSSGSSEIRATAIQPDGRIVLGGRFNVNNSGIETNVIRLSSDGGLDGAFTPPYAGQVLNLALQPDGKIVTVQNAVHRFNADGSNDLSFHIPTLHDTPLLSFGFPVALTVDVGDDGRILIGGDFNDVDDPNTPPNSDHWSVARLNSDGTLDATLTTSHKTGYPHHPESFTRRADDSTLIGFAGFGVTGALPHNLGRLFLDGSLDPSFDPVASLAPEGNFGPDFVLSNFSLLAGGGFLASGGRNFDESGFSEFTYGKLFADLTEDTSYIADPNVLASFSFSQSLPLADGKVLVGNADFDSQRIVNNTQVQRLSTNGSVDNIFQLDPAILADTVQRDGNGRMEWGRV